MIFWIPDYKKSTYFSEIFFPFLIIPLSLVQIAKQLEQESEDDAVRL